MQGETLKRQPQESGSFPLMACDSVPKVDAGGKVLGGAKRVNDLGPSDFPGVLCAKILHCPHPVALVKSVAAGTASALPGVKAMVTRTGAGGFRAGPATHAVPSNVNQVAEASNLIFAGEPVAAVAAETEAIAEDALRLIEVRYETSPLLTDGGAAGQPTGAQPAEGERAPSRESPPMVGARGSGVEAFQAAGLVVYEGEFRVGALPNGLEPPCCVAAWEGETVTVWASTGAIFQFRNELAAALNIPSGNVRIIADRPACGGLTLVAQPYGLLAALLAQQAGRPVKLTLDHADLLSSAHARQPATVHIKVGARRDGSLEAIDFRSSGAAGASDAIWQTYQCPNLRTQEAEARGREGTASDAVDVLAANFALEQAMDELARQFGMDPLEFRRKNLASESCLLLEKMFVIGAEKIGWRERRAAAPEAGPIKRGVGMAVGAWRTAKEAFAQAEVRIHPDGRVEVVTGAQDSGAGTRTVLAMIAAEELGVPLANVTVSLGDTAAGLAAPASGAGLTLAAVGSAVRQAARDAKQKLAAQAAAAGAVSTAGSPGGEQPTVGSASESTVVTSAPRPLPWTAEGRALVSAPVIGHGRSGGLQPATFQDYPAWGVQFVDVSVDAETGVVKVNKVVTLAEAGRVMNRLTFETELIGGAIRGLGAALGEAPLVDRRIARVLNPNLRDGQLLGALESPPIEAVIMDAVSPANSLGVKGLGDLPMLSTAAAVANAVAHALGVRICELPLTPAKILASL